MVHGWSEPVGFGLWREFRYLEQETFGLVLLSLAVALFDDVVSERKSHILDGLVVRKVQLPLDDVHELLDHLLVLFRKDIDVRAVPVLLLTYHHALLLAFALFLIVFILFTEILLPRLHLRVRVPHYPGIIPRRFPVL